MEEKKYPIKWEYKSHSYQIGDTGDYDGYWEVTNGRDSLITKDDYEDIEKDLQAVVDLLNNTYANFKVDRGNEAALEAENKLLIHELEELRKAQPRAVWVKASERLPAKDGYYCFKANGGYMGAYLRTAQNGSRWFCDSAGGTIRNWKNCEWLDESPAAGREEDAVAFGEWIRKEAYQNAIGIWNNGFQRCEGGKEFTTAQLYKLFKQQKEK